MRIEQKAARSGLWYAGLSVFSQVFSWLFTMFIARLLRPEDYGLMTMASFLTAYMEVFSELGLGSAIVQKKEITQEELSSVFWFSIMVGVFFCACCFPLAYPTAWIFKDRRIIPVTFMISSLFIIGSAMTVPFNMLRKDFGFKQIGIINIASMVSSNLLMVALAMAGCGVYTLISGVILFRVTKVSLMFFAARWKPSFHFTFRETKPFLRFGINVAGSGSLIRVFESLDKFIVGRLFNARLLGFYGFAMSLASMPTDKIWPIFNQILFPLLSRYQDDSARCNEVFLKILKLFSFVIIPLYAMGIFFGKEILLTIVGAKWEMAIPFFKAFCVAKLFDSMNEFANLLHTSKGHPQRVLVLAIIKTITMPLCILFAALHSFASLTIPWAIVFPGLCIGWMIYTFEITKIKPMTFLKSVSGPCAVTLLMVCGIYGTRLAMIAGFGFSLSETQLFIQAVATGLVLFCGYVFLLDRKLIIETIRIFRS